MTPLPASLASALAWTIALAFVVPSVATAEEGACPASTSDPMLGEEAAQDIAVSLRQLRVRELRAGSISSDEEVQSLASPPEVPPVWSASIQVWSTMGLRSHSVTDGRFLYDAPGSRYRATYIAVSDASHAEVETDMLGANGSANITSGTMCHPGLGIKFENLFAWLPTAAVRAGSQVIDGEPCALWKWKSFPMISACLGNGGIPRRWVLDAGVLSAGGLAGQLNYTFTDVHVGPLSKEDSFANTAECVHYSQKPCTSNATTTVEAYRIANPGPWTLSLGDRNAGDLLGEANFLCTQDANSAKVLSVWRIHTYESFGGYTLCNYMHGRYVCLGGSKDRVGRRSVNTLGSGARGGQCSPNEDIGSQFSFPRAVECGTADALGSRGCMWKAELIRQVPVSCILQRGLLRQCSKEQKEARMQTLLEAVAAPEEGGCQASTAD